MFQNKQLLSSKVLSQTAAIAQCSRPSSVFPKLIKSPLPSYVHVSTARTDRSHTRRTPANTLRRTLPIDLFEGLAPSKSDMDMMRHAAG